MAVVTHIGKLAVVIGVGWASCAEAQQPVALPDAASLLSMAQSSPTGPQGDSWGSIEQLPDFVTGTWAPTPTAPLRVGANGVEQDRFQTDAPFTSEWQKIAAEVQRLANEGGDVPGRHKNCIPTGFGGRFGGGTPGALMESLFAPGRVMFIPEKNELRRIYTDGRKHPEDPDITFYGHSIGHWNGGALIVDTVGLNEGNELIYGIPVGKDAHIVERIYLAAPNLMRQISVVEAPQSLTKPWVRSQDLVRRTDWQMREEFCTENNRGIGADGEQIFDLTPPAQ